MIGLKENETKTITWEDAVRLAAEASQKARIVLADETNLRLTTTQGKCLVMAIAQRLLIYPISHYDVNHGISIRIRQSDDISSIAENAATKALESIVTDAESDPEIINMAVLMTAAEIIGSICPADFAGGLIAGKITVLISDCVTSELEQRCLKLAATMHLLDVFINRSGIWAEVAFDVQTDRKVQRIRNQAIRYATDNGINEFEELTAAVASAATILAQRMPPASET